MQAAESANQFVTGPKIKMISVSENDLGAQLLERLLSERFDGSLRANGQKKRRLHHAVGRGETARAPTGGVGLETFEEKSHALSVSGEDEGPTHAANDIQSPDGKGDRKGLCAL